MSEITIPIWLLIVPCVVWSTGSLFVYAIFEEMFKDNKHVGLILLGSYLWPLGLLFYIVWAIKEIKKDYEQKRHSIYGYEQAEKEQNIVERKSPITGGKLQLLTEEGEVSFRGEKVKYPHKHYHCIDSGEDFTDTELDDDNMWAIFRAYCEKRGFELFSDIVFRKDLELTQKDIGCILEIWLTLNREESYRNMSRDEICKVVLNKYKETIK